MKLRNTIACLLLTAAMAAVVLGAGLVRASAYLLGDERFLHGVSINGLDVSDMTPDAARALLSGAEDARLDGVLVTVQCGGERRPFTARELGAQSTLEAAFTQAYSLGRNGAPLDRIDMAMVMRAGERKDFTSVLTFEIEQVRVAVKAYADTVYTGAHNATVSYDVGTRAFSYTPESDGYYLDGDALADKVWQRVQSGGGVVEAEPIVIAAECTEAMLRRATTALGSVRTKLPGDEEKRHNIELAAAALNGSVLMPGGELSLNAVTGERSEEKGYIRVQVLTQGDEGGGVNQLAGTLYRAALLADMEIVERRRLSAPASYLPIGFDASVEWKDKDLRCRNKADWPMYIAAYIDGDELAVDIYGAPRSDGLTVKLLNEVVETIQPPEPQVVYDASLALGRAVTEIQERNGYSVNTYRRYLRGDEVVHSESVSSDYYPAVRGRVREGTHAPEGAADSAP